jgi:hypothetical protein
MADETKTTAEATKTADTTKTAQDQGDKRSMPGFEGPVMRTMALEEDPNHHMEVLLAGRKRAKTATTQDAGDKKDGKDSRDEKAKTEEVKTTEKGDQKLTSGLTSLIADALKFRPARDEKAQEKAKEEVKTTEKKEAKEAKTTEVKAEEKKTVVTKKKAEPSAPDAMRIATEAAGAAAGEAVKQAMSKVSESHSRQSAAEDELPDDYKHDYEVAKYLAATNPKYKDAPKAVLNEFARTEEYARRWEEANPGKRFDANSEDHNEFYSTLDRPWDEHEFRDAEIGLRAEHIAEQKMSKSSAKLRELEERNAKSELSAITSQTVNTVAVLLAKTVDEAAHEVILKEGFPKLQESDPITADALIEALDRLSPRIQTAIFVDDPEQRITFDAKKNRDQAEWLNYLFQKEEEYSGRTDDKGRLFASRSEFVKLTPAQQARRWYLTPDHIISEMVADAVTEVKSKVEKDRERGKKVAAALGYVPREAKSTETDKKTDKSDATNKAEDEKPEKTTSSDGKPVSPSVGAGAKIDHQDNGKTTPYDDLWAKTGKILFGR